MTSAAPVIHICGFPGSGKFTIGRCLAKRIGGKLLHNHLALEPASALFDRTDARHATLRAQVRAVIYSAARDLASDVPVIVTDALEDTPLDHVLFAPTQELATARGAPLRAITLAISLEENRRRLQSPMRAERHKLNTVAVLDTLRKTCRLLQPPGALELEVTDLSAAQAAGEIMRLLALQGVKANA